MNLLYGRNSGELSALDKMSNALLRGRRMHGAVGISAMHEDSILQASAQSSAAAASTAGSNAGFGINIFGMVFTDEIIFWAVMINIVTLSIILFIFIFLCMVDKMPRFMCCARGKIHYENIDENSGVCDGDGGENGDGGKVGKGIKDIEDNEQEMLISKCPGDAA